MGKLTGSETILMVVVIAFGLVFFAAVCAAIYFLFKRLARLDKAENEHFNDSHKDAQTESQSDTLEP